MAKPRRDILGRSIRHVNQWTQISTHIYVSLYDITKLVDILKSGKFDTYYILHGHEEIRKLQSDQDV